MSRAEREDWNAHSDFICTPCRDGNHMRCVSEFLNYEASLIDCACDDHIHSTPIPRDEVFDK